MTGLELTRRRGADYGRRDLAAKLALLRAPLGRVLDVGCAEGANAQTLRGLGATELSGIDADEQFATAARERYDSVVHGRVPHDLDRLDGSFDTILAYDVLEHLYDPWGAVQQLAGRLRAGGQLHVSLPNARSKRLWAPLIFRGTFEYEPEGIMDVTHLRFFTRRDAIALVEHAGLNVVSVDHAGAESRKRQLAYALTRGRAAEFLTIQWYVLGVRESAASP